MNLLIFFALPFATILLSIVLQNLLKSPILVGITFFAIYLIISFASFQNNLAEALIATIIYSILAFATAYIIKWISMRGENNNLQNQNNNLNNMRCCRRMQNR